VESPDGTAKNGEFLRAMAVAHDEVTAIQVVRLVLLGKKKYAGFLDKIVINLWLADGPPSVRLFNEDGCKATKIGQADVGPARVLALVLATQDSE
jgi:hypothetical protein